MMAGMLEGNGGNRDIEKEKEKLRDGMGGGHFKKIDHIQCANIFDGCVGAGENSLSCCKMYAKYMKDFGDGKVLRSWMDLQWNVPIGK